MTWIGRFLILLISFLAACGTQPDRDPHLPTSLAIFTESRVTVEIVLRSDENNQAWLEATFTPEDGYHLYSKESPPGGIDGLGRPTLLELLPGSQMIPTGALTDGYLNYQGMYLLDPNGNVPWTPAAINGLFRVGYRVL